MIKENNNKKGIPTRTQMLRIKGNYFIIPCSLYYPLDKKVGSRYPTFFLVIIGLKKRIIPLK